MLQKSLNLCYIDFDLNLKPNRKSSYGKLNHYLIISAGNFIIFLLANKNYESFELIRGNYIKSPRRTPT
jgi:hypothetical protein